MTQQPLTDQQLDDIEQRAARLYERTASIDPNAHPDFGQLTDADVPALIAEVRRQRAAMAEMRQRMIAARDATETLRAAQAETSARLATSRQDLADSHDDLTDALGADSHTEWADLIRAVSAQRSQADLLRDAERYLSALHGSVARHDNLAANLGCAGCELRDKIRAHYDAAAAASGGGR